MYIYLKDSSYTMYVHVCMYTCAVLYLGSQPCPTLCNPMDCRLPGSSIHVIFPDTDIGLGCPVLLQGIFPTHGLKLCLLYWQGGSLPLSHQGSPFSALINSIMLFLMSNFFKYLHSLYHILIQTCFTTNFANTSKKLFSKCWREINNCSDTFISLYKLTRNV